MFQPSGSAPKSGKMGSQDPMLDDGGSKKGGIVGIFAVKGRKRPDQIGTYIQMDGNA